ncbi:MAG: hypothetical protein AB1306_06635 [Nitrospirota bacterium]
MKKDLRRLFGLIFCFLFLAYGTSMAASFSYDFNNLTGSDTYPYANLNGQDGWTSQGFPPGLIMGVTNTSGFDGTKALRFEDVGAGYGADASHLRTPFFAIPTISGFEPTIILQGDLRVGAWSNILRFAYDANSNGVIRQTDPVEIGPGLDIGTVPGVLVWSAAGTPSSVALASLGINGGDWVRLRLEIDPMGRGQGVGRVYYQNLTQGDIALQPVAALQNVNMEFNWGSATVTNPSLWDSVYLHEEGAGNGFDNLYLATATPPPACSITMNMPTSPTNIGTFAPGIFMSYDPMIARPFGLEEAGDILTGRLWLPCLRNGHADIYLVLDAPAYGGKFMLSELHQWLSFPANIQPWQTYTDDDVYAALFSLQKSGILPGNYKLDVIVVPSGTAASTIDQIVSGATAAPYYKWSFTETLP